MVVGRCCKRTRQGTREAELEARLAEVERELAVVEGERDSARELLRQTLEYFEPVTRFLNHTRDWRELRENNARLLHWVTWVQARVAERLCSRLCSRVMMEREREDAEEYAGFEKAMLEGGYDKCAVCLSLNMSSPVRLGCGHVFCAGCVRGVQACPKCRAAVTSAESVRAAVTWHSG